MTARTGAQRRTLPLWAKALFFAVSYVLMAEFGNLLSIQNALATFWPPAGLFVAVLLISKPREWPVLLAVGLSTHLDRYDAAVVKACVDLYERGEAGL